MSVSRDAECDLNWPTIDAYRQRPSHPQRVSGTGGNGYLADQSKPLVSIITVVRNAEHFLPSVFQAAASQTHQHLELIVVDGASSDGTLGVLRNNQRWVTRWLSEPDDGIFDAMNKGIALARGKYVKLLNADDYLPRDSVARAVSVLESLPAQAYVRGRMRVESAEGRFVGIVDGSSASRYFPAVLHPTWYVPMSVYATHGLYRRDLRISADYECALRFRRRGVLVRDLEGDPLATFRVGGASSGLGGVPETFGINREYFGLLPAAYVAAWHTLVKTRARAVEAVVSEETATMLRGRLQQFRAWRRRSR